MADPSFFAVIRVESFSHSFQCIINGPVICCDLQQIGCFYALKMWTLLQSSDSGVLNSILIKFGIISILDFNFAWALSVHKI